MIKQKNQRAYILRYTLFQPVEKLWIQENWIPSFEFWGKKFSAVRKVMYTTNAVESVNFSFRKVTKKGAFPNENALLKLLCLQITQLYKKWKDSKVQNWAMVRNQLVTDDKIKACIEKYEHLF